MNIFFISHCPKIAAQEMVDRHVVKMILETAQLLSTAHRLLDGEEYIEKVKNRNIKRWKLPYPSDQMYLATHVNHPSAVWTRESIENYNWLFKHFTHLLEEYTYRYGKQHKCEKLVALLQQPPLNIPVTGMTPIKCAMKEEFKVSNDPIKNYRNYYRHGKTHLFKWTKREVPRWINSSCN